jgi:hypothetical protein
MHSRGITPRYTKTTARAASAPHLREVLHLQCEGHTRSNRAPMQDTTRPAPHAAPRAPYAHHAMEARQSWPPLHACTRCRTLTLLAPEHDTTLWQATRISMRRRAARTLQGAGMPLAMGSAGARPACARHAQHCLQHSSAATLRTHTIWRTRGRRRPHECRACAGKHGGAHMLLLLAAPSPPRPPATALCVRHRAEVLAMGGAARAVRMHRQRVMMMQHRWC